MRPIPPNGVTLLNAEETAGILGGGMERLEFLQARGFIRPIRTPRGPGYREDLVRELRAAIIPPGRAEGKLKPGEAARILGVTTRTLHNAAAGDDPVLHRDAQGMYDADEVYALNEARGGRKFLRPVS